MCVQDLSAIQQQLCKQAHTTSATSKIGQVMIAECLHMRHTWIAFVVLMHYAAQLTSAQC